MVWFLSPNPSSPPPGYSHLIVAVCIPVNGDAGMRDAGMRIVMNGGQFRFDVWTSVTRRIAGWDVAPAGDDVLMAIWKDVTAGRVSPGVFLDYLIEHELTDHKEEIERVIHESTSFLRQLQQEGNTDALTKYRHT